jgi:hypothetical protein
MFIIDFLQLLFAGTRGLIISGASGAIISGYVVARVTFGFQKRLLAQQLEANRKIHEEMLAAQQKGQEEFHKFLAKLENDFLVSLLTRWNNTFEVIHNQIGDLNRTIKGPPPV